MKRGGVRRCEGRCEERRGEEGVRGGVRRGVVRRGGVRGVRRGVVRRGGVRIEKRCDEETCVSTEGEEGELVGGQRSQCCYRFTACCCTP